MPIRETSVVTIGIDDLHEGSELLLCPKLTGDCLHQSFDFSFCNTAIVIGVEEGKQKFQL